MATITLRLPDELDVECAVGSTPQNALDGGATEIKTINSSDEPVKLRCRIRQSTGFSCVPPFGFKTGQWLVDTTQSVTANIVDAEGE